MRAARSLVGLEAQELAKAAGVNPATISRMEKCRERPIRGLASTVDEASDRIGGRMHSNPGYFDQG